MKLKLMTMLVQQALGTFMRRSGLAVGVLAVSLEKADHGKLPKDVQALYVEREGKYVLDLPESYEDVTAVKGALAKERAEKKEAERLRKELEKRFEGIDPDEVKKILERMGSDEERQLLKDGKIDEVVTKRMAKAQQAHEKALKTKDDDIAKANSRSAKFEQRVLDNHVRAAATKAGLHPNAVEDALFRARTIFKLDEEGNAVQLDSDGKPVLGKDGKTAFTPDEWLTGMKETAPHWFPSGNTGSGATGNRNAAGVKKVSRADFDAMDTATKATTARDAREGKVQLVD